jgi:hypothetical protein
MRVHAALGVRLRGGRFGYADRTLSLLAAPAVLGGLALAIRLPRLDDLPSIPGTAPRPPASMTGDVIAGPGRAHAR